MRALEDAVAVTRTLGIIWEGAVCLDPGSRPSVALLKGQLCPHPDFLSPSTFPRPSVACLISVSSQGSLDFHNYQLLEAKASLLSEVILKSLVYM